VALIGLVAKATSLGLAWAVVTLIKVDSIEKQSALEEKASPVALIGKVSPVVLAGKVSPVALVEKV
jgi:hypothetical protein